MIARSVSAFAAALFAVALWALVLAPLTACSASAVDKQVTTEAVLATANNRAVELITGHDAHDGVEAVDGLYVESLKRVVELACGDAVPCDTRAQEVRDAVAAERKRWAPVRAVWRITRVSVEAYREQLATCQSLQSQDAGAQCTVNLAGLAGTALGHVTDLRCALRELGVTDPFPGELDCGVVGTTGSFDAKDGGE